MRGARCHLVPKYGDTMGMSIGGTANPPHLCSKNGRVGKPNYSTARNSELAAKPQCVGIQPPGPRIWVVLKWLLTRRPHCSHNTLQPTWPSGSKVKQSYLPSSGLSMWSLKNPTISKQTQTCEGRWKSLSLWNTVIADQPIPQIPELIHTQHTQSTSTSTRAHELPAVAMLRLRQPSWSLQWTCIRWGLTGLGQPCGKWAGDICDPYLGLTWVEKNPINMGARWKMMVYGKPVYDS